eukprot:GFUD01020214.1.p1 GENE.GFUD01020214.1~~GFUD01020214.1.p1  ORF type:complete len:598 (-),score=112.18 GFUD01020214.1:120-1697(-)
MEIEVISTWLVPEIEVISTPISTSSATTSSNTTTTTTTTTSSTAQTATSTTSHKQNTTRSVISPSTTTIKSSLSVNVIKVWDEIDALFSTEANLARRTTTKHSISSSSNLQTTTDLFWSRPAVGKPLNTSTSSTNHLQTCLKIQLSPLDFQIQNDSVYVPAYGMEFPPGHFWLSGPNVIICQPFSPSEKFSPMMGYVTIACLGLSIICLTFHLAVSCIAPQLQNLSGKNLFSLSLALLCAYTSFLTMFTTNIPTSSCMVLAVFIYYFYLAAFFWMLNIAFDVAWTLKQATRNLSLTSGPQWKRFFIYSLIGWLLPAIIVAIAAVIDVTDSEEISEIFKPGFGKSEIGLCWFSRKSALLIYFVIPVFIIMVLNIFFFISSAFLVWNTTRSSAKITTSGPKINFFLYLRLLVLMGLSWTTGLIAGWLDMEPVWYVFIVLNTLQGLFILVFFTFSKKIATSVKEKLCGESNQVPENARIRGSEDSVLSGRSSSLLGSGASLTGSGARPFKYSATSYDQYKKYDQRYYS